MGDEQTAHGCQIKPLRYNMRERIGGKINQPVAVDDNAGTRADILATVLYGIKAVFAAAEQRGYTLGGGGA
jgi:hypothetical protein